MTGEIEFFRKRFVGGFNRKDVVGYISKLAKERNTYREAKEAAEQEVSALKGELESLRIEIEAARQEAREGREYKVATLEAASQSFAELEESFKKLYVDLKAASERTCEDIDKARDTVTSLPSVLERAGEGFRELQEAYSAERNAVIGGRE